MLEVAGFLSNIGIKNKELGVNKNMFGSFLVSSVGTFKVDNAYAPLCRNDEYKDSLYTHRRCFNFMCS